MKTSVILNDGVTQIMFTPENDNEKKALSFWEPGNNISLAIENGSFMDKRSEKPFAKQIQMCQGGYLRAFDSKESKMLVLTPFVKKSNRMSISKIHDYIKKTKSKVRETNVGIDLHKHLNESIEISNELLKILTDEK